MQLGLLKYIAVSFGLCMATNTALANLIPKSAGLR